MLLSPFGPPVISRFFPDAVRDRCLSVIAAHGCSYNLYTYSGVCTNQRFTPEQREHFLSGFSGCGVSVVIDPDAAARALSLPCVKLLMKPGRDMAAYERAASRWPPFPASLSPPPSPAPRRSCAMT